MNMKHYEKVIIIINVFNITELIWNIQVLAITSNSNPMSNQLSP